MIILIIFLAIIALLILIGMIKINLHFSFSEDKEFNCFIKILFFKMTLLPFSGGKRKKKKSCARKNRRVNSEDSKKDASINKKNDKKSFMEILKNIQMYVEPLPKIFKKLFKGVKIKNLSVVWCISTDDACETALQYARCCGCFYNLFRMVKSICNVKVDKIRIFPDFINEKSYCIVFLRLQISVGRLLICALGYLLTIIIKSLNKNKRSD